MIVYPSLLLNGLMHPPLPKSSTTPHRRYPVIYYVSPPAIRFAKAHLPHLPSLVECSPPHLQNPRNLLTISPLITKAAPSSCRSWLAYHARSLSFFFCVLAGAGQDRRDDVRVKSELRSSAKTMHVEGAISRFHHSSTSSSSPSPSRSSSQGRLMDWLVHCEGAWVIDLR